MGTVADHRGPVQMTGRIDDMTYRYGRTAAIDCADADEGRLQSIASEDAALARAYLGGFGGGGAR